MVCPVCQEDRQKFIGGKCQRCYHKEWEVKHKGRVRAPNTNKCSVCGVSPTAGQGLCAKHYARYLRHGHTEQTRPETWGTIEKHPLYHMWSWMKRRSGKANAQKVCAEWLSDFRIFASEIGVRPSLTHKLRLLDPEKEYCRDNVFWADTKIIVVNTDDKKRYHADYAREYRLQNPENSKHSELKRYYGITLVQYEEMWLQQDGLCKICNQPETNIIRGKLLHLSVDHDHTTGKIRGLLCHHCNKALGGFKDSPDLLQRAINYLASTQTPLAT
jgi:hypothetical protein